MNKKLWLEQNYWTLREEFEDMLIDIWYNPDTIDEVNDWREEFINSERKIFKEQYSDDIENY